MSDKTTDGAHTWVYGKDGWYMARWVWVESYSKDLESKGYRVERSFEKPREK